MIQRCSQRFAETDAEVFRPAPQQRVKLADYHLQAFSPFPCRDLPYPLAQSLQALVMDADTGLAHVARDPETEVLAVPRSSDGAFFFIDHQLEFAGDKAADRAFHPFRRLGCPYVYGHIVGVAYEPQTPLFQLFVEFIKHDVGKQRRKWPALRRALLGLFYDFADEHTAVQVRPDEFKHPLVLNACG